MKNINNQKWLKIIGILLLVGALWGHPYSYYEILRWVVSAISAYLAYTYFISKNTKWFYIFAATAVLFNPIVPIYLQQQTWQFIDLASALMFLVSPSGN